MVPVMPPGSLQSRQVKESLHCITVGEVAGAVVIAECSLSNNNAEQQKSQEWKFPEYW